MKAIHHRNKAGAVDCNAGQRWPSRTLTSTKTWGRVTCKNCLRTKKAPHAGIRRPDVEDGLGSETILEE
jgi:hypothetical protein